LAIQKLLDLCTQFLEKELPAAQFAETFEMYMFDYGDELDEESYIYLDEILEAVSYFDIGELKEDDENFIDETELRSIVKTNLHNLKTALSC
jgi:hypothetical protein